MFCVLVSNIFAADLESHIDCMKAYLLTFKWKLDSVNGLVGWVTN